MIDTLGVSLMVVGSFWLGIVLGVVIGFRLGIAEEDPLGLGEYRGSVDSREEGVGP